MKKLIFLMVLFLSISSFSKDNYIFDSNRIKTVFSQYEILTERSRSKGDRNEFLDILDRENDIRIQISDYYEGDTIAKAKERFSKSNSESGFVRIASNNINLSKKYLGQESYSYSRATSYDNRKSEDFFFNGVKFSIEYVGGIADYENTLKMIKEAIDPNEAIKNRPKKTFSKNYSIDNYIDKNKLVNDFKKIYKNVKFEDIKGNNMDLSCYKITIDANDYPRAVWIQANNNYSKKVIDGRTEFFIKSYASRDWDGKDHSYKYTGEEKNIMQRYFGVNAKVYENDYMKRVTKQDIIGIYRYAVTDKYTITTVTFLVKNQKKVEQEEYEQFLSLVKSALK